MAIGAIEIILFFIAIIIAVYLFLKAAKYLIVNSVLGLILLAVGNLIFKFGIAYSASAIFICALGGIPGAILIMLFHVLGIAF